jgi:3-oxoacyl-[acyl-carrier protein] reductase
MVESARLAGKRALVTGGGRGIGAAIARRLAAEGAAVAVNYVADAASADALVRELTEAGHRAVAFRADVEDPAQTQDLVKRVRAEFGGVDLLASNAGIEHFGALESITKAGAMALMAIPRSASSGAKLSTIAETAALLAA